MTPPLLTIGGLARAVGLARGTLLHYESLGLLRPRLRSGAGYRLYGPDELERLRRIRALRDAGLPLRVIGARLSQAAGSDVGRLLEQRLLSLEDEIRRLHEQQRRLARLIALDGPRTTPPGKSGWVGLLRSAGFTDDDMWRWHADFEAEDAVGHARFLRAIGLSARERAAVRRISRSRARR